MPLIAKQHNKNDVESDFLIRFIRLVGFKWLFLCKLFITSGKDNCESDQKVVKS